MNNTTTKADRLITFCSEVLGANLRPWQKELIRKLDEKGLLKSKYSEQEKEIARRIAGDVGLKLLPYRLSPLNTIPTGWRFYSCDWSIQTRCSIVLKRTEHGRQKWQNLSEKQQEKIDLFISGVGADFDSALVAVTGKCTEI